MLDLIEVGGGKAARANGSMASRVMSAVESGSGLESFRPNDVLLNRDWIEVDKAVTMVNVDMLSAYSDLISAGLVLPLSNALGTTAVEVEKQSEMTAAATDMGAETETEDDRLAFSLEAFAVPVTHKGFRYNARALASSRRQGMPLDTASAEVATRRVNEACEDMLLNGISGFQVTSDTRTAKVLGYRTATNRITSVSFSNGAWDAATMPSGQDMLTDVFAMRKALRDLRFNGPYWIYAPSGAERALDQDYKALGTQTVRERLLQVEGVTQVRVLDRQTAASLLMVNATGNVVKLIYGYAPTAIQWEEKGGLVQKFMIMSIMAPMIRTNYNTQTGIVHVGA